MSVHNPELLGFRDLDDEYPAPNSAEFKMTHCSPHDLQAFDNSCNNIAFSHDSYVVCEDSQFSDKQHSGASAEPLLSDTEQFQSLLTSEELENSCCAMYGSEMVLADRHESSDCIATHHCLCQGPASSSGYCFQPDSEPHGSSIAASSTNISKNVSYWQAVSSTSGSPKIDQC